MGLEKNHSFCCDVIMWCKSLILVVKTGHWAKKAFPIFKVQDSYLSSNFKSQMKFPTVGKKINQKWLTIWS